MPKCDFNKVAKDLIEVNTCYVPKENLRMNLEKYSITYTFRFILKVGTSCNERN